MKSFKGKFLFSNKRYKKFESDIEKKNFIQKYQIMKNRNGSKVSSKKCFICFLIIILIFILSSVFLYKLLFHRPLFYNRFKNYYIPSFCFWNKTRSNKIISINKRTKNK